jgi:hypothetical protein
MKLIVNSETLELGKEYYLDYDGDKIKGHVCDIHQDVVYFSNIVTLQNKGYHKQIPDTEFMHFTRPIAYTYQDLTEIQKHTSRPVLQMAYLAVRFYKNHQTYESHGFYVQQEFYYINPEDSSQLVNFYIIHHGEAEPLRIYQPMRDIIFETNQRRALQQVMDRYTIPDVCYYSNGLI